MDKKIECHVHIKAGFTTTYHPEGNPVERVNKEIGRMLRTYCYAKHTNWVKYLDNIRFWINNTVHETTGYTPHRILFGEEKQLPLGKLLEFPAGNQYVGTEDMIEIVRKRVRTKAEKRNNKQHNQQKFPIYKENQKVLIKDHRLSSTEDREIKKFFLLFKGPYHVKKVNDNNTLLVQSWDGKEILQNIQNVKPYFAPETDEKVICL